MGQVLSLPVQLESIDCVSCGGTFALNEKYVDKRREDGKLWHCPYCDLSLGFIESEVKKLQKRLDAETAARRIAQNNAEQLRKQMARAKKRTAAGVCPCCQRTFTNMARHIKQKHPTYAK